MTGSIFGIKNGLSDVCQESIFVSKKNQLKLKKSKLNFEELKFPFKKFMNVGRWQENHEDPKVILFASRRSVNHKVEICIWSEFLELSRFFRIPTSWGEILIFEFSGAYHGGERCIFSYYGEVHLPSVKIGAALGENQRRCSIR